MKSKEDERRTRDVKEEEEERGGGGVSFEAFSIISDQLLVYCSSAD